MANLTDDVGQAIAETLVELMALPAPTGQEEPVLAWCRQRWQSLGAEVQATPVGNVLAWVGGQGPRLLIQGHADEIGFVVKSIDARGFVWLADGQAGSRSFHHRYPVGQPALIVSRAGQVDGVFASATGHILSTRADDRARLDANDLFVDVGADSRAEAEARGVHVGAGVIWNPAPRRLGQRVYGKAIDDRVALALITHLLTHLDPASLTYQLTVAATVQEEIGLVGATSLGDPETFDLAIAIDNGPIADYPGVDEREIQARLGHGPTLVYKDSWTHYDRRVIERLLDIAATHDIPVQEGVFPGFGSDGAALMRAGVPTALLAIATRYTHSAFEMADTRDLKAALALLQAFITSAAEPLPLGPS
ncbi:MAG: M42 family metallopeptidase [Thermomicrobiales bacterium]